MTQQYRGGLTALAWLGAILTGCGGWVDLDSPRASGGSASGSVGAAGKPAAIGGAVGTAGTGQIIGRGQSGGPTNPPIANGQGGDSLGAGGADTGPAPHGSFQLLVAPPPTLVPPGADGAGVTWTAVTSIVAGSLEQGALVGANDYCFRVPGGSLRCDWEAREPFVWTEAEGMVPLDHLRDLPNAGSYFPHFVSSNGDTVVGEFSLATGAFGGFFRWSKTGGVTTLGEPVGTFSGSPEHMSTDGTVISGLTKTNGKDGFHEPFLWTVAHGYQPLVSFGAWPGADLIDMSADGAFLVGETPDSFGEKKPFRFSPATDDREDVAPGPGLPNCAAVRASRSGGRVFGVVGYDSAANFVWTHEAGFAWLKLGATTTTCSFYPNALTFDGAIAFGSAQCGGQQSALVRWTPDSGVVALPAPPTGNVQVANDAISNDGSVVFGRIVPGSAPPGPDEGVAGTVPFRWSVAGGLVPLQSLPGHSFSYGYANDASGSVLVGRSGAPAGSAPATSEAVLWDGVGVVGVAAYLTTLGANLQGAHLQSAVRVATHGTTTVVQGVVNYQDSSGAWIAWLPQRH
jgi:uncharacterized membrane protein